MAERLICNQDVAGSIPASSSTASTIVLDRLPSPAAVWGGVIRMDCKVAQSGRAYATTKVEWLRGDALVAGSNPALQSSRIINTEDIEVKLTKKEREELKGLYDGKCAYCGNDLGDRWHADHAEPILRETNYVRDPINGTVKAVQTGKSQYSHNDTKDNLMPSCPSCNIFKGGNNIEEFRKMIAHSIISVRRETCYKFAERYGLVYETGSDVQFHFESYV